jgi:signal transduction histidine kinase
MRWSLSTKITLAFLGAILLFVAATLVQVRAVDALRHEIALYREASNVLDAALRLDREIRTLADVLGRGPGLDLPWTRNRLRELKVHGRVSGLSSMMGRVRGSEAFPLGLTRQADSIRSRLGALEQDGHIAQSIAANPVVRGALSPVDTAQLGPDGQVYPAIAATLLAAYDAGSREQAKVLSHLLRRHLLHIGRAVADFRAGFSDLNTRLEEGVNARRRETLRLVLVLHVISLVLALALLVAVIVGLRPVRLLIEGVRRVARGELDALVQVRRGDEIGQLAAEFNVMAAALKRQRQALVQAERLAAIGKMAAQVAHEIRNPLNAIALNVELIEEEIELGSPGDVAPMLTAVKREVGRLTEVTDDYLRFARLPSPRRESVDLAAAANDLVRFQAEEARRRGVAVSIEAPASVPAQADPDQLRQALLNLLRNAVEAAGEGGHVTVHVQAGGGRARLVVSDDGPGVATEDAERVFEPFYSSKDHGTGLGLALARRVAEAHGGTLSLEPMPPGHPGARFLLDIPTNGSEGET